MVIVHLHSSHMGAISGCGICQEIGYKGEPSILNVIDYCDHTYVKFMVRAKTFRISIQSP